MPILASFKIAKLANFLNNTKEKKEEKMDIDYRYRQNLADFGGIPHIIF